MKKLILVGVLAAACSSSQQQAVVPSMASDSADMIFEKMTTSVTSAGVLLARVSADSAWYYQSTMSTDLKGLRVVFTDSLGRVRSTITSRRGTFKTVGDQGFLDARDSVVAVTPGGDTLRTSHLLWDKASNKIESDSAFTMKKASSTQPITFTRYSGKYFTATPDFKSVKVQDPKARELGAPAKKPVKKPVAVKKDTVK